MNYKYLGFDSNYFCWRAFHSTGNLRYADKDTGVIFGFLNQVLIQCKHFEIKQPLFFWDSIKSKRKDIFPGYKDRKQEEMTDDEREARRTVYTQTALLRSEILPLMGFNNNFIQQGYEADDLIAQFVMDNPDNSVVLSNDDDLLQLLNYCIIYSPSKDRIINKEKFKELYRIEPNQWVAVKQIGGCKSDTVPGVSGIGEVYAIQYLKNELKKDGKRYNNITSKESRKLIKRNKILVKLPFPGTKPCRLREDKFNSEGFLAACDLYGLQKLKDDLGSWELFFK